MKYLEVAISIGNKLLVNALRKEGMVNWLSYSSHPLNFNSKKPVIVNLNYYYYDGLLGIALFYAYLYQETKDENYKAICLDIIHTIERMNINEANERIHSLYSGLGGKVYVYHYVGSILSEPKITALFEENIELYLSKSPLSFQSINDIISGPISLVSFLIENTPPALLNKRDQFLDDLGQGILNTAKIVQEGKAWNTIGNDKPLIGYAHGTSGYIHALLELYTLTKNETYIETIHEAVKYEDAHFNHFYKNWPDLRKSDNGKMSFMQAWCHGSPGVVLSRLIYEFMMDKKMSAQTSDVLMQLKKDNTERMNDLSSFSLCHGLAGNCEPFFLAAKLFNPEYKKESERVGDFGYELYFKNYLDFPSGMLYSLPNPSMMVGDVGVGMFYLRLHNPNIPSPILQTSIDS